MQRSLIFFALTLIVELLYGQECPNRIGDFILNETTISNLPKICSHCDTKKFRIITNAEEFLESEVSYEDLNNINVGSNDYFELLIDKSTIAGWYSKDYASISKSTRVLFLPSYLTDNMSIKNLLLKFHNDTLYYIQASLPDDYLDILIEKYKEKGYKTTEKKTKHKCKNRNFQKYLNRYSEFIFSAKTDSSTYSKIVFDFGISKDCQLYNNNHIEIFNLHKLLTVYEEVKNELLIFLENEKIKSKEESLKLEKELKIKMSRY